MDAHVGKLLLLAALMGCLAPALSIAAALSYKWPFLSDDTAARAKAALAALGDFQASLFGKLQVSCRNINFTS